MNRTIHGVTAKVARRFPRSAAVRLSLAVLVAAMLPAAAHGQATVTWDGGGDMTWTQPDSTSWIGGTYQSGDTALFAGAGEGVVTISGTVTPGQIDVTDGSYNLVGVIGGSGGVAKSGSGTLTLSGSSANAYAGITTVSGGTLTLNKATDVVAVPGDLTVSGSGTRVTFPSARNGQIGDTAAVTMNAPGGVFNGTVYGATTGAVTVTDTIGSLTVSAGQFNTGGSVWTVSGAGLIDGTAPSTDARFVGFSGSATSFNSLRVTGMNDTASLPYQNRSFFVGGNSTTTKSTVTVGAGGLELSGSNLKFHPGAAGTGQGSRLVLDGNVTVTGSAASTIGLIASEGRTDVTLSSTAGTVTRTFTVADVTSSDAADLSVTIAITDGEATAATLAKAGLGTMLLTAANTYSGGTTISAGTLAIGDGGTTGSITGSVTNDGTLAFNRSDELVFGGAISGSGGLVKDGAGELILEADNTYSGTTTINAGTLAVGNETTTGAIAGDIVNDATLIFRRTDSVTYSGAISGSGTMLQGVGTLELAGSTGNTMSGLTSISASGKLQLNKSSGNAIGGDLTINGSSTSVTFLGSNQIADTAIVQVTSGHFNGTAPNTGLADVVETIGQLQVSGTNASFSTSDRGTWIVTGAMSYEGGSGARFVGNSGSTLTVGSLSLTDMTAVAGGTVGQANSFTVYGNGTTAVTTLTVGSAGLALENSRLNLRRGSLANTLGSRLVLDGGVTVTGSAASLIAEDTAGGTLGIRDVELSSTAGSHVRTFTVADVTSSTATDLTVSVPITNGAATSGGITKAGDGTLLLSAANTFTGPTSVSAGTLALGGASAVAGSSGLSIAAGATLDLSALGSGLTLGSGQSLGGAGSILGSLLFDSGSSLVFSTTETLTLSGGTASFFAGTPGSRFGIDDLVGLTSSTPLNTYTLISGTVDFTNLDNVGAGSAYDLGNGVLAYFQQGSLQVTVVPEPAGVAVWGLGLVVVGVAARRWRR